MVKVLGLLWYPAFLLCLGFGAGGIVAGLKAASGGGELAGLGAVMLALAWLLWERRPN